MKTIYLSLKKKKKEIEKEDPIYISQKDFSEGTYIIDQPGHYVLTENILFNPNPDNDYLPKSDNPKYQTLGFSLGFFACVAISAKDVYLNLNGYKISASPEFALQQRFFSIIELSDAPFLPKQGPGDFSNGITSAENTIVANGSLGLSSHHGIHGNLAKNILLEDLKIKDFEFVGIALNGGGSLLLKDIKIGPNRVDVPVLATYSGARFAKMFANHVLNKQILSQESSNTLIEKLNDLQVEMDETFSQALNGEYISSDLFRNETKLPDGNVFGVVIKNPGVAVNDFAMSGEKTNDVFLYNVDVNDLRSKVDEVIAISTKGANGASNDSAGAVFQIEKVTRDGKYSGTTLSELQLYLTEIGLNTKPLGKNNISKDILNWCKTGEDISALLKKGYKYKCGGDSMFHVNKGNIAYRLEALNNLVLKKCRLRGLTNKGFLGNDKISGSYEKSHDFSKRKGYFGADSTGLNISYCSQVKIRKCCFDDIVAKNGDAIGINIISKSDVVIEKVKIKDVKAGTLKCGKWRGTDYYGETVKYKNSMPNKIPRAIGIRIQDSLVDLDNIHICDLHSPAKPIKVLKE